ncbi:undecaprenyl-diphosphate phosphatase [Winogradskya consettensis]|uniref:Undecaprenyl-diphosphatase n=1 Tax=Winogradskya consettensis TaxID=113560 RepID=A0A919SDF0_9ACTN|nr:undecaprenyl-diphosphate phosphatase [Actinoplanes consettensis]GIM70590.1 undecaprenyl-diphosphatase 1 [Actinoplanes consettensis]
MNILEAVLLGAVEGFTEFLPISSTGHLTIVEKLLGYQIDAPDITAFTAIIQSGAVFATLIFLRTDIIRIIGAWVKGVFSSAQRSNADYRFGWAVILGSIPIGIAGLLFQDAIETTLRSLWFVAGALIIYSFVMWFADHAATEVRHAEDVTWKDTLIIGVVQCLAVIPGVSRSGSTMTAGLLRDLDRVTVTKLSFFLSIPALFGATILQTYENYDGISSANGGVGWTATITATIVSFIVGWFAVSWLLKFVAKHSYSVFIGYRLVLGSLLLVLLATGAIDAK